MGPRRHSSMGDTKKTAGPMPEGKERNPSGIAAVWDTLCRFSSQRTVIVAASVLLLAALFVRYAEPLSDPDLWWHMALGDYMLKNHTLKPDHSLYSWTVANPNWIYNGWIPQIFFDLLYRIGGTAFLHISHYFLFGVILALFLYYNSLISEPLNLFYLLAGLAVMVILHLNSSLLKPEMFSVVFMTLTAFVYFTSLARNKNLFWAFPLVMLVWVNSHGGFIFGLAFISTAFAGEAVEFFFRKQARSRQRMKHFFIALLLTYGAVIVTPYGPRWMWSIITYFSDPVFMNQANQLIAYHSIFEFYHPAKYILIGMVVSFGALMTYVLVARRHLSIPLLITNLLFIYLSFMYARSAYLYPTVWYFSMGYLVSVSQLSPRISRLAPVFLLALIVSSLWTMHWAVYYPQKYRYVGFGVGEYMPEKVADFYLQHKLKGPLFNTYEIGGYLLWRLYPQSRVFIDPRHGPYTKHLADEYRQFEIGNNFQQFTEKYAFRYAIVKLEWIVLVNNFIKSPDWRLAYFDESSALFVHKSVWSPDLVTDLEAQRFRNVRSYEALIYVLYVYLAKEDFKSAWEIMALVKEKYNYGGFRETIAETEKKIAAYEKQKIKQ